MSSTAFAATSRYSGLPVLTLTTPDGHDVPYVARRMLPPTAGFAVLQTYAVTQGERLDNITARFLGDPEQFWRLCDSNGALRPDDLTARIGRVLRITLPAGVPGA
ncbi:MAG: LysM peptidoglycan-binding domain-containing protein [Pseudomonadota bacterium]|nr:LysM peptidoglycan-binding domain-containing protein [Pseudomonadota bacterium]